MSLPDGFEEGSHGASVQWVDGLCCQVEEEVEILEELRELLMVRVLLAERSQSREVLRSGNKRKITKRPFNIIMFFVILFECNCSITKVIFSKGVRERDIPTVSGQLLKWLQSIHL